MPTTWTIGPTRPAITIDTGSGYRCVCGQWVAWNVTHWCSHPVTTITYSRN